jgi:hypothetical protein
VSIQGSGTGWSRTLTREMRERCLAIMAPEGYGRYTDLRGWSVVMTPTTRRPTELTVRYRDPASGRWIRDVPVMVGGRFVGPAPPKPAPKPDRRWTSKPIDRRWA